MIDTIRIHLFNYQSVSTTERICLPVTQNTEEAEDLVQDTMYKALSNHDKFESGTNLKDGLYHYEKYFY